MNIKNKILRGTNYGIVHVADMNEKHKLQIFNTLNIVVIIYNLLATILYLSFEFYTAGIILLFYFLASLLSFEFLARRKAILFRKILSIEISLAFLFFVSYSYNYPQILNLYYFIILLAIVFVFTKTEILYRYFCMIQAIALFLLQPFFKKYFIQSDVVVTSLLEIIFMIVLFVYFITFVYVIVYFSRLHENRLVKLRDRFFILEKKIKNQNEDLMLFGLSATHSLKTPLYVTNSFLNNLKKNLLNPTVDFDKSMAYIKLIKESNKQTEKYAKDLNSYNTVYNIHTNKIKTNIYKELELIIKGVVAGNQNIKISNETSKNNVILNVQLFEIVSQNLIVNAFKYNNAKTPTLKIYTTTDNHEIAVYFQDNGIGINPSFSNKIFQPFTRINEKEGIEGSGLGLSAARIAAERLNGSLTLFESSKKGSIFKLTLNQ